MRSIKRVTSLSLSEDVIETLDKKAYERRISKSALADETLRHGLAVVDQNIPIEPELSEPDVQPFPKTYENLMLQSASAAGHELNWYREFAESQKEKLNFEQCYLFCQLIALAAFDQDQRNPHAGESLIDENVKRLSKISHADAARHRKTVFNMGNTFRGILSKHWEELEKVKPTDQVHWADQQRIERERQEEEFEQIGQSNFAAGMTAQPIDEWSPVATAIEAIKETEDFCNDRELLARIVGRDFDEIENPQPQLDRLNELMADHGSVGEKVGNSVVYDFRAE